MEPVTPDLILDTLQKWVEEKQPIGPEMWLEAAQKLTVLSGGLQDNLFDLERKIAEGRATALTQGESVAKTKVFAESLPEYVEARKLKAKIDRITEIVRISKLQARLSSDNLRIQ